jgi:type IV pilus assembly protein PilC
MEFRCRLGTPGGEILEGIYVADSEDRLRRELEEKGLYILSLQRRGGLQGINLHGRPGGRVSRQEFLVFNPGAGHSFSRPGMPLVQSLDILRQARLERDVQGGSGRHLREGQSGAPSLSDAFSEHGSMFPRRCTRRR